MKTGVTICDEWADEKGELGPVYGRQWRSFPVLEPAGQIKDGEPLYSAKGVDQITQLIGMIKATPQPPPDCLCLESRGRAAHGAAAMPYDLAGSHPE